MAATHQRRCSARTRWAAPSAVTTWKRARRRCRPGSHQRSSSGHGPAQAGDRLGCPAADRQRGRRRAELAPAADRDRRPGGVEQLGGLRPAAARPPATAPAAIPATARHGGPQPLGGVVGVGEVGGRRRHPAVAVAGQPPAAPRRHEHRLVPDQPGQPGDGARRPLVGGRRPAPQPQLVAVVAAHLVGRQPQQHDPRRQLPRRRPAVELPAHPLDHRRRRQPGRPVPGPLAALAVLGLGGDDETGAHPALGGERGDELVGEVLADEHQRVELHDRLVEGLLDATLGRRLGAAGRALVEPAGQAVGVAAGRAEPGQDVAGGQRGEVAEAGQAQAGEQADQLGVDLADVRAARRPAAGRGTPPSHPARRRPGARPARRAATAAAKRPSAMPTPTSVARLGRGRRRRAARPGARRRRSSATGRGRRGTASPARRPRGEGRTGRRPARRARTPWRRGRGRGRAARRRGSAAGPCAGAGRSPRPRPRPPASGRRPGWRAARRPARRRPRRRRRPASRGTTR